MNAAQRLAKRIVILIIFLLIITSIVFLIKVFSAPKETCTDGIKNQNEEDIDCGGVCQACQKIEAQDLVIGEKNFVETGGGIVDVFAVLENPNQRYGGNNIRYKFILKSPEGNEIAQREGTSFILPGETKYIIENNFDLRQETGNVDFEVLSIDWIESTDIYEKPQVKVVNREYNELPNEIIFSEAKGLVKNESPYDFSQIGVRIILKGENGEIIALNSTQISTIKSQEERAFRVIWDKSFAGLVRNMEVQTDINVFNSETFFKRYFKLQKFQEYE